MHILFQDGLHMQLSWQDPVPSSGYYIYKKTFFDTAYQLLNQILVTGTTFIDTCVGPGMISYMVRSADLKASGSGTYYNLSTGVSVSIVSDPSPFYAEANITMADPGQANGSVTIYPQGGCEPYSYIWNTGQTTSGIYGLAPGEYCVTISECMGCTQFFCATVDVLNSAGVIQGLVSSRLYPNPAGDQFVVELQFDTYQELQLYILDNQGRRIAYQQTSGKVILVNWDIGSLSAGQYWLRVEREKEYVLLPFIREEK